MGTWNNYLLFIYVFYYRAILEMALRHYELASTTVTGIPMKEEQNASSSANYDVELFHKASAHWRLLSDYHDREGEGSNKLKNEDLSAMMPQTQKEGFRYNTITLKWCTPRGSSADLHPCTALARVTPTDVNSRPSSCLTNFLLSGRSVMLEMPRRSGTKILSHMVSYCRNPFTRRVRDGMIPTTSGEATSGRNYEFSTSQEWQFQFNTSNKAISGRN